MHRRRSFSVFAAGLAVASLSVPVVFAQSSTGLDTAPLVLKKYGRRTGVWARPTQGAAVASHDGEVTVELERGAIERLTHVTVQRIVGHHDPRIGSGTYEFGPRGHRFASPVEICFANSEIIKGAVKANQACLGYFDERAKKWVCEDDCLETSDEGRVCGATRHFTNFAVLLSGGGGEACERGPVNDDYAGAPR